MQCVNDGVENVIHADTFISEFSAVRHESMQNSCKFDRVPASTYMEIAKDAFIKYYQDGFMELRDVVLFAPFVSDSENPAEIRTLIKKETDHLKFIISSKTLETDGHGNFKWIKHAEGLMYKVNASKTTGNVPKDIKSGYSGGKNVTSINAYTKQSGQDKVWNINLCTCKGDREALLEFEIPEEMVEILQGYMLTPNIIDCLVEESVGCVAEGSWSTAAYDSLVWYGAIPQKGYINIEKITHEDMPDSSGYDIKLFDQDGNILVDIRNYKIIFHNENQKEICNESASVKEKTNPFGGIYDGYSTAKHSRTVDDISSENNAVKYVSSLSWRQMNCRDRSIALLLGHKDDMLVNYFKFFIGAKRGYDLKGCGLEESDNWMEEIFHSKVLEKLGYKLRITDIDNQKNIHSAVSQVIDDERPVCVWFDEYYLFYTPFYLNSHTGHIAVVNGYNKEKKLYSVFDHNHLRSFNTSREIEYGRFYCTFETLENIYSNQGKEQSFIITLDKISDEDQLETGKLHEQFMDTVKFLILNNKAGKDAYTVYNSVKEKGNNLDIGCIDRLYAQLGGKELLIDTLLKYFCPDSKEKKHIQDLSIKIINDSNMLINNYVTSLYRGKAMHVDRVEECIKVIENSTLEFFKVIQGV
ncbi:BtrH N-terminal domain-containing protein [Acetivibrio cellulolyticus]|uniref:BtrH N-terminal domain-containing protein n=1 Tax=Acetivibrio cellulolyticus TaxID=35830 RepID=UPI0001E2FAE4|nr:BtrH N-terminal domain-containing protein [Acetivibrio cellulolyticus]